MACFSTEREDCDYLLIADPKYSSVLTEYVLQFILLDNVI